KKKITIKYNVICKKKLKIINIIINIVIAIINQRLLVSLSDKKPPIEVPITPATPLINNATETNDRSCPPESINGLIYMNVTEFATNNKNVIPKYFVTSTGLSTLE